MILKGSDPKWEACNTINHILLIKGRPIIDIRHGICFRQYRASLYCYGDKIGTVISF